MIPRKLLELAERMLVMEERRPRQTTLRRAISTGYYSLFHLLVGDYTALFSEDPSIRAAIGRTVNHRDMVSVARDFSQASLQMPKSLQGKGLVASPELIAVAQAFIDLQVERHDAD